MAPEQLTAMGLEWGQLTSMQRPFGPRMLGRSTRIAIVALRIYAIVAIPLVVFAFLRSMH